MLGSGAIQALGVITGIILARGLGPTDRGAFAAMVLWPTIMVTLGDLGLVHSFGYFTASAEVSLHRMIRLAHRAAAIQSLYLVPVTLLVAWFGLQAADADPITAGLALAALFVPAALVSRYVAAVFQGRLRIRDYFVIRISMPLVIAVALSLVLIFAAMNIWNVVFAYLVGLAVMVVVTVALPRLGESRLAPAPDEPSGLPFDRRRFLGFGLRALPGTLYPVEALYLDQLVVGIFLGAHDLGLYVSALAFTSVIRLAASAIGINAMPTIAGNPEERQRRLTLRFVLLTVGVLLPIGIVLIVVMPIVLPAVFGQAFVGAVEPARFLVVGSLAFGVRQVLGQCVRGSGRPGIVSLVEVASWPLVVAAAASGTAVGLEGVTIGLGAVQVVSLIALVAASMRRKPWRAR